MSISQDDFLAGLGKLIREERLFLGYETASSFARAIGYPPDRYRRYERRGICRTGVLVQLAKAVETSGHGRPRYALLFDRRPDIIFHHS